MENNNNNGRGIFYGVIGVATLVVAMIGATFAYFSAQAAGNANAIAATATSISLTLAEDTTGIKQNLIPVDETLAAFATGGYVGILEGDTDDDDAVNPRSNNCIDDDGNEFCSVYQVTITNPSTTTAQTIYAKMDVQSNSFTTNAIPDGEDDCSSYLDKTGENALYCEKSNLAFAIFKGTAAQVIANTNVQWDVDGTAVTTKYSSTGGIVDGVSTTQDADTTVGNVAGTSVTGKLGDMVVARTAVPTTSTAGAVSFQFSELTQTLKPGGSATYTIVMWLHENGEDQESDETKAFAAGITFSTSLNGQGGVTAVLSTSGS